MDIRSCDVVLASASPRRKEILHMAEIRFQIIPATGEEIVTSTVPTEVVKKLSLDKAAQVSEQCAKETLIIGADTVVALNGEIMGKPQDRKQAFDMLHKLQGNVHSVFTGVSLVFKGLYGDTVRQFSVETKVKLFPMTDEEILDYIATGEPMDKAGAYGIQGRFAEYVEGIHGDYLNVVGLPLSRLLQEIKNMETM